MSVIRVKRRLDLDEGANADDAVPSTLFVKKVRREEGSADPGPETPTSLVFSFHHSTAAPELERDPRLLIPRVRSASGLKGRTPTGGSDTLSSTQRQKRVADMFAGNRNARFKVVSQNRMLAGDGSELKVLDVTQQEPTEEGEESLPEAVRQMMKEYTQSQDAASSHAQYIYDVYFLDGEVALESQLADTVGAIAFELNEDEINRIYFDDGGESEDGMDDDDDSNAEDNWRNEYPDEEDEEEDSGMHEDKSFY
ncbi:hypothetical protein BC830DRAFT_1148600 [Chytriomyces sp. MP71]|nr:hypothetical protein BC830DRAFT_1148600 [Chytriomyces sp. MP71]